MTIADEVTTKTNVYNAGNTTVKGLDISYRKQLIMECLDDGTFATFFEAGDVMQMDMLQECVKRYEAWKAAGYP